MDNQRSGYLTARYLDGLTSQSREVTLSMTDQSLILSVDNVSLAMWSYSKVFVKEDWVHPMGGTLGYKDNPDASLVVRNQQQFQRIQKKLVRRHQATFIIPTQYRHLFLMAIGAVAAGFLLFPILSHLASWATYLIPRSAEAKLGQVVVKEMADDFKPCDDKEALASLQKITKRLSLASGEKNADPEIHLFQSQSANAFSLPGQNIAVLSAFLNDAKSENEVAAAMAHEMGHMVKRDSLEAFVQSQGIGIIVNLISASGSYGSIAEFASFMQNMNYSRQKEFRADEYGSKLLIKAGYSPEGLSSFLTRMDKGEISQLLGKSAQYVEFLSTHPDTKERVKRIKSYSQKSGATFTPSLTPQEFAKLKNACRALPESRKQ